MRPRRRDASRCGVCGRRAPRLRPRGRSRGAGGRSISARRRRSWRRRRRGSTAAGTASWSPAPPWARHGCRFTRAFEQQVAWLATHCSKSAVCELMRICWPTVGRIIERVVAERAAAPRRSARRAAADRDRRALLPQGAALHHRRRRPRHRPAGLGGRRAATSRPSRASSTQLGPERAAPDRARLQRPGRVDHPRGRASAARSATLCLDPFHVVALASDGARRGAPRGLATGPPRRRQERRPLAQRRPLGALEATRTAHRAAAGEARRRSSTSTAASTAPTS